MQSQSKKQRHAQSYIDLEAIKKSINQKTVTSYTNTLDKNLKSVASLKAQQQAVQQLGLHPSITSFKQTYGDGQEGSLTNDNHGSQSQSKLQKKTSHTSIGHSFPEQTYGKSKLINKKVKKRSSQGLILN